MNTQKVMPFEETVAKIQAAGLDDEFISAIEKDPELMKALNKISPDLGTAIPASDWSCCITV